LEIATGAGRMQARWDQRISKLNIDEEVNDLPTGCVAMEGGANHIIEVCDAG
jgi:hypothetical protein